MPHADRGQQRASFERERKRELEVSAARKGDRDGSSRMERHSGE
jgi:hypothetical protein